MATRTVANGGGNYNDIGTWVEGAVPSNLDDVVFTGTSGQLTVNVASAAKTINFTNYTNTMTFTNNLTVSGSVTHAAGWTFAGAGQLIVNATNTLTSGGNVFNGNLTFNGTITTTLVGDWIMGSGTLNLGNSANTHTFNGNNFRIRGNATLTMSSNSTANIATGTTAIQFDSAVVSDNPTWSSGGSSGGTIRNNVTVNTDGSVTLGTFFSFNTGTLRWIKGTVINTGSTLQTNAANTTFNLGGAAGMHLNNFLATGNVASTTFTLQTTDMYIDGDYTATFSTQENVIVGTNRTMFIGGSLILNNITTGTFQCSTASVVMNGTGSVSMSAVTTGRITTTATAVFEINTSGTITLSNQLQWSGLGLKFTAGTIDGTACVFSTIGATSTFTNNVANLTFLGFRMYISTTVAGTQGFTSTRMQVASNSGLTLNIVLQSGNTYVVTDYLNILSFSGEIMTLKSSTASAPAYLNLQPGYSGQVVCYLDVADIDSSGGATIWNYIGTNTSTVNWGISPRMFVKTAGGLEQLGGVNQL
jgi:hypothetical protein